MLFKKCCSLILAVIFFLSAFSGMAQAEGIGLSALSAILYEPQTGRILYERDAHTPRAMASTTKIMTALIAVESCPLDQIVTVSAEAVRVEGSSLGLSAGDQITMKDLVTGLLLESGNDAANVVAYTVSGSIPEFAKRMNERAAQIGMKESTFVTPSGLDEGEHSSSAYDMALLAAEALKNETIASICSMESAVIYFGNPPHRVIVNNHNRLLNIYPYAIGMKTGYTRKSGRCLVSAAVKDGVKLIAVSLNGHDDWNDHIALYDYGFSCVELAALPIPELPEIPVSGASNELQLQAGDAPKYTLLKGEKDEVQVKIEIPRFIIAPVTAGEQVGEIQYILDGKVICSVPLTAAQNLEAKPVISGWKKYYRIFYSILLEFLH